MIQLPLELENYILTHIDAEDPVLARLNRDTHAKMVNGRMCSGHLQGSLLTLFSQMIHPRTILEMSSFT